MEEDTTETEKKYEIIYSNTDQFLLKQFAEDMSKVFGVKPKISKNDVRVRSKRIFDRIKALGGGKSHGWFIGPQIRKSSKKN